MNGFCYFIGTLVGVGGVILGIITGFGIYETVMSNKTKTPQDKVTMVE